MASYQSNPIRVQIVRLQSMARSIRVDAGEYRRRGKSLFNTVASSTGWEGQDAQVFRSQMEGFEDDVEKMAQLMESYAAFLDHPCRGRR